MVDLGMKSYTRKIIKITKDDSNVEHAVINIFNSNRKAFRAIRIKNYLIRAFNRKQPMEELVSDLTYVKAAGTWHYICLFIDLFNREIIGYSAGKSKDANIVSKAISRINHKLEQIKLFHTDRGKEFNNHLIDEVLETFIIKRSLSTEGCPYDNAVAEATMKAMKTEFLNKCNLKT
ncbi:DDE-type integrase/transposase/recombinase [Staphylococcus aureus]|uniref:DDE-type integrase/transposase/recombinase n=1 Tax=Staphylococcus aureus TaxID=1280 RepID=UPI003F4A8186